MKEADWRSKLVKQFNMACPTGIIWINDVRFKAGWPDVYTVIGSISSHYELKLLKTKTTQPGIEECMTKLQIAVCKRLAKAGARTFTLMNCPLMNSIFIHDFTTGRCKQVGAKEFEHEWSTTGSI